MAFSQEKPRKRRIQERAETTKFNILNVASKLFSEKGFDGVTVRDIEVEAGVQRNLASYHFGSKKDLWKAAAAFTLEELKNFTHVRGEKIAGIATTHERVAYTVRSFIRFCAKYPQLNRLLIEEGTQNSWRIEWLVENLVKPNMIELRELVESDLGLTDEQFINWYYLLVGGGAMIFSLAPEAKLLFDVNTLSDDVVNRHADMLTKMLLLEVPDLTKS